MITCSFRKDKQAFFVGNLASDKNDNQDSIQ